MGASAGKNGQAKGSQSGSREEGHRSKLGAGTGRESGEGIFERRRRARGGRGGRGAGEGQEGRGRARASAQSERQKETKTHGTRGAGGGYRSRAPRGRDGGGRWGRE